MIFQVGCTTKWDSWSSHDIPSCSTHKQFRWIIIMKLRVDHVLTNTIFNSREYERIYDKLTVAEYKEFKEITNCLKPCKYRKYVFIGDLAQSTFKSEHFAFSLWAISRETIVKTELLIYPLSALVAEFGGTLSLFLGFSFMTLWDNIVLIKALSPFVKLDFLKTMSP